MSLKVLPLLAILLKLTLSIASDAGLKVPVSFAFITVTHTRGKDYSIIQKHIQRYAAMDCPIATELNIVWNNEIEPEKAPIKLNKNTWKRPVNFLKTPNNSMDWRYKIPEQSTAEVFFIVDDDVNVDCEELKRGFKVWQENAIGSVGPIVTYAVRFFEYTQDKTFEYGRKKEEKMFTIGLVGLSFMSRHFMDLYYAPIELIEEMRKTVREKNNCDDIGINWLVQYFYPELETVYVRAARGNLLAGGPAIAQSTSPTHYPYRSECLLAFTNLFGVNALRYKPITDKGKPEIRIKPLREATVIAKWKYLDAIIKGKTPLETQQIDLIDSNPANEYSKDSLQQQARTVFTGTISKNSSDVGETRYEEEENINIEAETAENKVIHKVPLVEILSVSVVILIFIISCLIYKLVALTHENKYLHLRGNQTNAVEAATFEQSD